ncbi:MAG: hypothetical protein AAFV54_12325 [Pseudomonadota bacterium]
MTDLVATLRNYMGCIYCDENMPLPADIHNIILDAVDEIERLRSTILAAQDELSFGAAAAALTMLQAAIAKTEIRVVQSSGQLAADPPPLK